MNLELLKTCGRVRKYQAGEFICTENETGSTAFLLLQGNVKIILHSFEDIQKEAALLSPGVIFGEMSLLENKPRNASVVAECDETLVLEIDKSNFLNIIKADTDVAFNLLRTLLGRVERSMVAVDCNKLAYLEKIRKDKRYLQIQKLTKEQFQEIVGKDSEYAQQLLKFLSHTLADINTKI